MYLLSEGKYLESVVVIGNIVIDVMKYIVDDNYKFNIMDKYYDKKFIFMIVYWWENIGKFMENIFKVVRCLIDEYIDLVLVYLMYKNLKVWEVV